MKFLPKNGLLKVMSMNAVSVGASFVLGIASSKIISVFLGSRGMVLLGSFRNFSTMARTGASLGISNSVVKLFVAHKQDEKALSEIYSTFFWLGLLASAVVGSAIFVFAETFSAWIFFDSGFAYALRVFALLLPLGVLNVFWIAVYNSFGRFRRIMAIQVVSNVLVFSITAFLIVTDNLRGGLLSVAVSEAAVALVTFAFVRKDRGYFNFSLVQVLSRPHLKSIAAFSAMALFTAIVSPLALLMIRSEIVDGYGIAEAGLWDASSRLSGFYMVFLTSGLSLYYMPKLSSASTNSEFKLELRQYFKTLVPLAAIALAAVYLLKDFILELAFSQEFLRVSGLLHWQLLGDLLKIATLAFGFQVLVKEMIWKYFAIELFFNSLYLGLPYFIGDGFSAETVLKSYFLANLLSLALMLFYFRKLFFAPRP